MILAGVIGCDQPNDAASIEAVDNVVAELDEAYQTQDVDMIKARTTPDHVAVTPYMASGWSGSTR